VWRKTLFKGSHTASLKASLLASLNSHTYDNKEHLQDAQTEKRAFKSGDGSKQPALASKYNKRANKRTCMHVEQYRSA
jgi:hypothetical protein